MSGKDDRMYDWQNFIAGGFAGVISRTFTSPLDVVKILAQIGTKSTAGGFLSSFKTIYREEGIKAFWKGNGIACFRLAPYTALQFAFYSRLKLLLSDKDGRIGVTQSTTAGATAGMIATAITYPTDMVKTRLTASHTDPSKAKYKGIIDAFKTIFREEGFRAYYKGLSTSILGIIPFGGGTFMAYEVLDQLNSKPRGQMSPFETFMNGCLAACFAQTLSFPFDTIRKKLQAQSRTVTNEMKPDIQFSGMFDAFTQTVKKNGVLGLWRGTTANLLKVGPYAGLMFLTFETSKNFFLYQNGYTTSIWTDNPKPGINQALRPNELKEELKKRGTPF